MSVRQPDANEVFTVRIFKSHVNNPALQWVNNYEIQVRDAANADTSQLEIAASACFGFERSIHLTTTRFERMTISTLQPDSKPYNPFVFLSVPFPTAPLGLRTLGADESLDIRQVLWLQRQVAFGRPGKGFYRNCLHERDVVAPAGQVRLTSESSVIPTVSSAVGADLEPILPTGDSPMQLVMVSGTNLASVRPVLGFAVRGVANVPFNHKYFDRKP